MKFEKKYPDARYLDRFKYNGDSVIKNLKKRYCCVCDDDAMFTSHEFKVFLCSEECLEKLWNKYGGSVNIEVDTDSLKDFL